MNASIKSTIITVVCTVALSIGGGWLAGQNQQTTNVVKIQAIEEQLGELETLTDRETRVATRVTKLEVQAKTAYYQIGRIDTSLDRFEDKIQDAQISSAKITTAIEQFTVAVKDLSTQTVKLSDVVSRLDERVKTLEKGDENGFYKRPAEQRSRSNTPNGGGY